MANHPQRAAFFDVDETLITTKSMIRFLEYHFAVLGRPADHFINAQQELQDMATAGVSRAQTNAHYYRHFAGQEVAVVAAIGDAWFHAEMEAGGLFHDPSVQRLRGHLTAGDLTVLVSGSFSACLDPIREFVGADIAVGTIPLTAEGRYTGEVKTTAIGPGKARIAIDIMGKHAIAAQSCYAYGDHCSDLDLLRSVGHPVVIGNDVAMCALARDNEWMVLPGISDGPRPALPPTTRVSPL